MMEADLNLLIDAFNDIGLEIKAGLREQTLNLGVTTDSATKPAQVTAKIYQVLSTENLGDYGLDRLETVCIYGIGSNGKALWKRSVPYAQFQITADDEDLFSFNNRFSNMLIFPGLLLIAALLNSIEATKFLLFGIDIWIHEVGHATVAWLCGYRAIPLPFGWTNVGSEKSLFVYFGVLTLLGLLAWAGFKEKRRWPIGLAIGLATLQFIGTWVISSNTFDMLLSFGGIGGEFYLSTLLIVSFFFPLPDYWRWDFYRYPAVLFAGFTFLGSFEKWRQIDRGLEAVPWGSLFGGSGDAGGDMNRLNLDHGWSVQQIIDTYNSLGSLCLIAIISVYIYFFLKQRNHLFLYARWQRWYFRKS